jgi:hypothetical protein
MKNLIALMLMPAANAAFAHDSTVPHLHPHASSLLPDYAVMLIAAALVACGMVAYRVLRKG